MAVRLAGKAWAAGLLGLPLAVGLIGLLVLAWPGRLEAHALPLLLLFFPTWIGAMSAAFLFPTGRRAWLAMGGATAGAFALIVLLKQTAWAGLPA